MNLDNWTSLRHLGRVYQLSHDMSVLFGLEIRHALNNGATISDVSRAADVTRATVRKYRNHTTEES